MSWGAVSIIESVPLIILASVILPSCSQADMSMPDGTV